MERIKKNEYENFYGKEYFWRTYDGQEIDFIEEIEGKLSAFEFKFSDNKKHKIPKDWNKHYKNSELKFITKNNYLDFVL